MYPRSLTRSLHVAALLAATALVTSGCQTGKYDNGDGDVSTFSAGSSSESSTGAGAAPSAAGARGESSTAPAEVPIAGAKTFSMAFPTGNRSTSAIMLEKEMPAEVILGAQFVYRIEVQNLTDRALEAVQVTDSIPTGFSVDSTEPVARIAGGNAVWQLGALPARSTKTLVVTGTANEMGSLTTCATVSYESMLCATATVVSPSLDVELTAPGEGLACDPLEIVVKVTNAGTGDARQVRVVEELPEGLTTLAGQRRIVMDFGTLASAQSKEQTVKLKASRAGAFTQAATAEAAGGLTAKTAPVTTLLREPRLTLDMTADENVVVTRPIAGRISVANTGDAPSEDTIVQVALPAGMTVSEVSEGGQGSAEALTWDLGTLDVGASRELSYTLASAVGRTYVAEAKASGRCAAEVTATARTEIRGIPALKLEVADESDLILVGKPVTYDIEVENQGSAADTDIVIVCEVEEGVEILRASGAAEATIEGRTVRFTPVSSLATGEKISFQVTVRSSKQFDSRFTVSLTSAQKTRPVVEEESTNFVN